tara:strand:- start:792 stop:1274 length:483 start_codon:yes stop_codon:yes gene_type:complete
MNKEQEFRAGVRLYLESLDQDIEPVLAKLIAYQYPQEVGSIDFEIFVDAFTQEFPVRAFFMDSSNSEFFIYVDGKAEYPAPVAPELLNIPCVYSEEFEEAFTESDEEFDPWHHATEVLIEWFSEKWLNAGGTSFGLKATISPHNSPHKFNLITSEWQSRC